METRYVVRRLAPSFDGRWLILLAIIGVVVAAASYFRFTAPAPPLELVALGADASFADSVRIPAEWADTGVRTPDAVARVPLILGVRNPGQHAVRPERLLLSVPARYRLLGPQGRDIEAVTDPISPLVRYSLLPELPPIEPQRLPELLPNYDTLWLEVLVPRFYCVALGDSIPDLVPAPPPPPETLSRFRIFYSFDGGDLGQRRTGTIAVRIDTSLLRAPEPPAVPTFPMETDVRAARPELGPLRYVGSRRTRCGEPEDPMELLSTVWETQTGGRFIALDYGGAVRKHLFDLDGDGVIERESWDPDGDGRFEATRRTRLRIPEFLLPIVPRGFDMAALDTLPPDSLARLDPFRGAMPGPGRLPPTSRDSAAAAAAPLPVPRIELGPLGRPVRADTTGG